MALPQPIPVHSPREAAVASACAALAMLPSVVRSTGRTARILHARRVIAACLYEGPFLMSYPEVAAAMGLRAHSAAIEAVRACAFMVSTPETRTAILAVYRAMYGVNPPDSLWERIGRHDPTMKKNAKLKDNQTKEATC